MSKRTPWMPFAGSDFYGSQSVKLMDPDAEAAYMRLLWEEWESGSLPADPEQVAELLPRKFQRRWKAIWTQIEAKFPLSDGVRRNPRATAERLRADDVIERRRKGAKVTNEARWKVAERHGERSLSDSLSDTSSDRSATPERHAERVAERSTLTGTDTRTEENQSPPSPLAGGERAATDSGNAPPVPEPEPRRQRPRRKPAEPWADVLERPEFAPLRESEPFVFGWKTWIEHCQTQGSKAREPGGPRAVAMFREALRVGPAKYAKAIEQAIGRNWQAPCIEALERGNGGPSAPVPNIAQRNFDSLREQAARLFGSESA